MSLRPLVGKVALVTGLNLLKFNFIDMEPNSIDTIEI